MPGVRASPSSGNTKNTMLDESAVDTRYRNLGYSVEQPGAENACKDCGDLGLAGALQRNCETDIPAERARRLSRLHWLSSNIRECAFFSSCIRTMPRSVCGRTVRS